MLITGGDKCDRSTGHGVALEKIVLDPSLVGEVRHNLLHVLVEPHWSKYGRGYEPFPDILYERKDDTWAAVELKSMWGSAKKARYQLMSAYHYLRDERKVIANIELKLARYRLYNGSIYWETVAVR